MSYQIFISYRRDGGDVTAKLICETLKNKGYSVFYDYDALKGGIFDSRILDAIDQCSDFVLILPKKALARCKDEDDWLRQEISRALEKEKNIIPVMMDKFKFPRRMPAEIRDISRYNGVRFRMDFYESVIDKIIEKLTAKRAPAPAKSQTTQKPAPAPAPVPVPPPAPAPTTRPPRTRKSLFKKEPVILRTNEPASCDEIEQTKNVLRQTMANFKIRIEDEIGHSRGPTVTRYEIYLAPGTSVRTITNLTADIALALATPIRIEAPIPGKSAIGIEVPNKVREVVNLRQILEAEKFKSAKAPLVVPLGLDVEGNVQTCDLAKAPHLLVAGTTGSGKSMFLHALLTSLIWKTSPEDVRLILIDPKQIEFAPYETAPHLYLPIVTDMNLAVSVLACAVQEMERRFSLFRDAGARNIETYNETARNDPDREHLPYLVIVIDELADLKLSHANNEPEEHICRLAQKARAAGIHLIIGTQRTSVNVITGALKSNITTRIAFKVTQQVDSRIILDTSGAEALLGRGDMLYMASIFGGQSPTRLQGAFISDSELKDTVALAAKRHAPVEPYWSFMFRAEAELTRRIAAEPSTFAELLEATAAADDADPMRAAAKPSAFAELFEATESADDANPMRTAAEPNTFADLLEATVAADDADPMRTAAKPSTFAELLEATAAADDADPMLTEAVALSLQAQKVATSLLQRRLGIGYSRAAKLIDRMEELGLVSPAEGNKPRKVLPAAKQYLIDTGVDLKTLLSLTDA